MEYFLKIIYNLYFWNSQVTFLVSINWDTELSFSITSPVLLAGGGGGGGVTHTPYPHSIHKSSKIKAETCMI